MSECLVLGVITCAVILLSGFLVVVGIRNLMRFWLESALKSILKLPESPCFDGSWNFENLVKKYQCVNRDSYCELVHRLEKLEKKKKRRK